MKIKQTAGRDSLGEFAPEFANKERTIIIRFTLLTLPPQGNNTDTEDNLICTQKSYTNFLSAYFYERLDCKLLQKILLLVERIRRVFKKAFFFKVRRAIK